MVKLDRYRVPLLALINSYSTLSPLASALKEVLLGPAPRRRPGIVLRVLHHIKSMPLLAVRITLDFYPSRRRSCRLIFVSKLHINYVNFIELILLICYQRLKFFH